MAIETEENDGAVETKEEAKKQNVILTARDLDIFEFALEMKFADLGAIHQKFFFNLRSGERSKSTWWARERLALLKQHGFLKSKRFTFSGKTYFLATELAHIALKNMRSHRGFVRPLEEIDVRTFDHDLRVIEACLALERLGRATHWVSERQLKSDLALVSGLSRQYQPDAIYQNKHGEPMAFELEVTTKKKDRYADKIRKYVDLIRQAEHGTHGFQGVLFIVCNDHVFGILNDLTRRHEGIFRIEKFAQLVAAGASETRLKKEVG